MTNEKRRFKSFLRWCARQEWTWMLGLPCPADVTAAAVDSGFHRWINEIEQADGTLEFRWVRFVKTRVRERRPPCYVLVGGLGSREIVRWMRRWHEIAGEGEADVRIEYRYSARQPKIGSVLSSLFASRIFDVEMRMGPRTIRRARSLASEEG